MDPIRPETGPTLDMTLDGRLLDAPTRWTRWRALWHASPRGTLPALLLALVGVLVGAILLVGFLFVVVPVALALLLLALLFRALAGPRRGGA